MGKSGGSRGQTSKISSAAAPAASAATTQSTNKSSILRSAFSPSEYQLALFASVIHGLDAQHLRIHNTSTGRLQAEHSVNPKETITSLDWGYHGDNSRARDHHSKKKRKRSSGINGGPDTGNVVVAFGTSASDIRMYSPTEDKIVRTLSGGHERGVRDFKFTANNPAEGWSIGGDGKLVQWDLEVGHSIRVISLPTTSISALARPVPSDPPILCASQTPYIIHADKEGSNAVSFDAMRNSVHTLIPSSADLSSLSGQFLAADNDRYINIFDSQKRKLLGSLVADKEVDSVSFYSGNKNLESKEASESTPEQQILAVVTQDGSIEIFDKPFDRWNESRSSDATSLKAQRKKMTRRADASVRIIRPDKTSTAVPILSASLQGSVIVVAWAEGGANLVFDQIRWQDADTDELILRGSKEIVKGKSTSSAVMNGVKDLGKGHVDESKAIVEQGGLAADDVMMSDNEQDAISISSDDEEALSDEGEKKVDKSVKKSTALQDKDVEMEDAEDETGEPSFGELLRVNTAAPIDVEAELEDTEHRSLVSTKPNTSLQIPSGVSLATVLTQSLRTNDNNLLESCFHTTDTNIVRTTIQRMDSSLAGILLQKLAERLSNRPGRYGHLLVWVQWTCVAHGGAIAGKADILRKMSSLFKVMDQRSASLSSLLLLKGKLDMLDAQLGLRQALRSHPGGADSEDEDNVIYVEGQEDEDTADEDEDVMMDDQPAAITGKRPSSSKRDMRKQLGDDDEDEEDDENLAVAINGISDSDADADSNEDLALLDDEAEESDDDDEGNPDSDSDNDEEELDDAEDEDGSSIAEFIQDSEDEGSDDGIASAPQPPPAKKAKLHRGKARGSRN